MWGRPTRAIQAPAVLAKCSKGSGCQVYRVLEFVVSILFVCFLFFFFGGGGGGRGENLVLRGFRAYRVGLRLKAYLGQ